MAASLDSIKKMGFERKRELGYEYSDDTFDFSKAKLVEVYSLKSGLRYMTYSANDPENILHNYKKDYEYYMSGECKYLEVYEIMKDGDEVGIRVVKELNCIKKNGVELEMCRYLRMHRLEYININLYARYAAENREDIFSGLEDSFIEKYGEMYKGRDKYEKYLEGVERVKRSHPLKLKKNLKVESVLLK